MNNINPLIAQIIAPLRPVGPKCTACGCPMDFCGWRTADHSAGEADLKQYECQNCGNIDEELGQEDAMTWIKPSERMPESGQRVLVTYKDSYGMWQTIAQHIDKWRELADEGYEIADIDEEGDPWTPEGWYEAPLQSDCPPLSGEVLYWMPIPEVPA